MSATVARLEETQEGLSEDELKVAKAIIYSRFRGHFIDVTEDRSAGGQAELVVWGARKKGPLFRIGRWGDRFVAFDDSTEKTHEASRLESLLEALRKLYPPMSVL